jgi:hypothetical protein
LSKFLSLRICNLSIEMPIRILAKFYPWQEKWIWILVWNQMKCCLSQFWVICYRKGPKREENSDPVAENSQKLCGNPQVFKKKLSHHDLYVHNIAMVSFQLCITLLCFVIICYIVVFSHAQLGLRISIKLFLKLFVNLRIFN